MSDRSQTVDHGVGAAAALWAASILLSRVIGVAREAVLGRVVGGGAEADVYFVAFILPDWINYLLAGGALSLVFQPIYGAYIARGEKERARECLSVILNAHLLILAIILTAAWLAAPAIAPLLAPGFGPAQLERLVYLTRIMLPAQLFHIVGGGILSAALQSHGRHRLPALAPLAYNLVVIAGGLLGGHRAGAEGFAWGVLAGAAAGPLALNLAGAARAGLGWQPTLRLSHPDLRTYFLRAFPIMLAFSVVVVDDWLLRRFGSVLGEGAVTTLGFAKQIAKLPIGVFGLAAGIATFPVLVRLVQTGQRAEAHALITQSMRRVLALALAAEVALSAAAPEVSRIIYGGRVPAAQHQAIGAALVLISLGLWAWASQNLTARGCYAGGNTWLPSALGTVVTVAFFPVYGWAGRAFGVNGLAATSAAAISAYGILLLIVLRRELGAGPAGHLRYAAGMLPAVLAGLFTGSVARTFLVQHLAPPLRLSGTVVLAPAAALAAYLLVAAAAVPGFRRELAALLEALTRRSARRGGAPATSPAAADDPRPTLRVLLTGGGTGGHVYPALQILRLLEREWNVVATLYVGTRGRAEETIVPREGLAIEYVTAAPIHGLAPARLLPALAAIVRGVVQSTRILAAFKPDIVIASGGYVSAPVCFAAFLLRPVRRIKVVIHEQNLVPGLMNKAASLFADAVMVSYRESPYFLWSPRCVHTGYPVRGAAAPVSREEARRTLGIDPAHRMLLVTGGSLGARSINRCLPQIVPALRGLAGHVTVVHAAGLGGGGYDAWQDTLERLRAALGPGARESAIAPAGYEFSAAGGRLRYLLVPYLHGLPAYLAAADLVVCRAGAGSLHEVVATGRAGVVVPKRGLPGDHQELNAIDLAESGACIPVFERRESDGTDSLRADELSRCVCDLLGDPEAIRRLEEGARARHNAQTGARIVATVRCVLEGRKVDAVTDIVEPQSVRIRKLVDTLAEFLIRQPAESCYRRFYAIKMAEWLESPDWLVRNNGVKLAGALADQTRVPDLVRLFGSERGYVRRNVLKALGRMKSCPEGLAALVDRGLADSYFEVRVEAFALAARWADQVRGDAALLAHMTAAFRRRCQHLEVRIEALRTLPLYLEPPEYLRLAGPWRFASNVRLRRAILEGLLAALRAGRLAAEDREQARVFMEQMLITTSDFTPRFRIRESYLHLQKALADERDRGPSRD